MEQVKIKIRLEGIRPLMFDRYAGDNNTVLPPEEKMYLKDGIVGLPSANLYSMLTAENTDSVCKRFFGKARKTIQMGIAGYTTIDTEIIPILDEKRKPIKFEKFNDKIKVHYAVARLPKGIPNPKERPYIECPWNIEFHMHYIKNSYLTIDNFKQALDYGGILGLGTFRPYFGRYVMTEFTIE